MRMNSLTHKILAIDKPVTLRFRINPEFGSLVFFEKELKRRASKHRLNDSQLRLRARLEPWSM